MGQREEHADTSARQPIAPKPNFPLGKTPDQSASGGAAHASLDMTSEKDRGLVRQAMKRWPKRWRGLDDSLKDQLVGDLAVASAVARVVSETAGDDKTKLAAAATMASIARTGVMMEAQNQADEHLEEKHDRIDQGRATEALSVVRVIDESA